MICKYCGSNISDDALFCPNCGGPQEKEEKETTYEYQSGGTENTAQSSSDAQSSYASGNTYTNNTYTNNNTDTRGTYRKINGMCIAGFVLSFFVSILGLIFSAIGMKQADERDEDGKGLATAGLVISIVFLAIKVIGSCTGSCAALSLFNIIL